MSGIIDTWTGEVAKLREKVELVAQALVVISQDKSVKLRFPCLLTALALEEEEEEKTL
ncbi:hypothetical protein Dsin_026917 [Dipteronia sinensis]|uniref:Uncharacterized protein n=1 Tax=Dipteronia sinensis TaxID=43782 RepID=A0AAD9ZYP3_9ROSI|nr:hypothetical protein Dsin_026917 [Dipteronia sinensis]